MHALVFASSAAVLALEIVLLRTFGLRHFHHFAYAAVSLALLGGGVSGTLLAVFRDRVRGRERWLLGRAALAFAVLAVAAPAAAWVLPFEPTALAWSARAWLGFLGTALALATPFCAGSAVVVLALLAREERTPSLYAASLAGSGVGAVLALLLLRLPLPWEPRASSYKALPQVQAYAGAVRAGERWSPLGWVTAVRAPAFHYAPGLSLAFDGSLPPQAALFVDGDVAGGVSAWRADTAGARWLDWLPAAVAYHAARPRRVLVLGAGGGLDVMTALAHGAERVVAVELNPDIPALAASLLDSSSDVYRDPRVRLIVGDARAYAARTSSRYDLIVLPPAESFGSAAGGLRATSEDYLVTVEAVRSYLSLLTPAGTLAVTRWVRTPPRDDVRLILTAGAALRSAGHGAVGARLVCVRGWSASTLLVRPGGFDAEALARVRAFAAARLLDVDWLAGPPPAGARPFNLQTRTVAREAAAAAESAGATARLAASYPFDVRPPTDDRPYFSHFVRLRTLPRLLGLGAGAWLPFAEWGQVTVLGTLLAGAVAGLVAMLLPAGLMARRAPPGGTRLASIGTYFGAIGAAYILVEMALVQQLQLLLGHPVYAVSAALAALLVFSGAGSIWSGRRAASWRPAAAAGGAILLYVALAPVIVRTALGFPLAARAAVATALVAPLAVAMGFPFPAGIRILTHGRPGALAWAAAVNGFASVVAASAASLVAVEWGWRWVLLGGSACYLVAALAAYRPRQILHESTTSSPRTTS